MYKLAVGPVLGRKRLKSSDGRFKPFLPYPIFPLSPPICHLFPYYMHPLPHHISLTSGQDRNMTKLYLITAKTTQALWSCLPSSGKVSGKRCCAKGQATSTDYSKKRPKVTALKERFRISISLAYR